MLKFKVKTIFTGSNNEFRILFLIFVIRKERIQNSFRMPRRKSKRIKIFLQIFAPGIYLEIDKKGKKSKVQCCS